MSEPIGLGIIGVGRWARAHAGAAARSSVVQIVNCYSRSPQNREAYRNTFGIAGTADSLQELLADPQVEAVIVSTPNDAHAEHAARAIEVGKPVLVDKPVSVDVTEGIEMLRVVSKGTSPVGVAHHARRLAGHRAARRWMESGRAGTVRIAHADFSNNRGSHLTAEAWHRTARGSEAGVLIQVGIHQIENLLYLLGPATSVNARFACRDLGPGLPDAAVMLMTHANGALSTVTSSWTTPSHYRLDLQGTGGNLVFSLDHGHWTGGDVDDHGELILEPPDGDGVPYPTEKGDPLRDQLEELGRAARDGTPMEIGVVEGLRAVAVVQAAVRSARSNGAPVDLAMLLAEGGATLREIDRLLGPSNGRP